MRTVQVTQQLVISNGHWVITSLASRMPLTCRTTTCPSTVYPTTAVPGVAKQDVDDVGSRTLTGYQYHWRPHLITPYR